MRKKSLMHQNCIKLTQRYFIKEKTIPWDKIISSTYMGWLLEKEDFPRDLLILARFEPYQILNQDESSLGNPFFSYSQIYGIFINKFYILFREFFQNFTTLFPLNFTSNFTIFNNNNSTSFQRTLPLFPTLEYFYIH